jgi:hypothetical protein
MMTMARGLFILNDASYGTEGSYNGIRFADAVSKRWRVSRTTRDVTRRCSDKSKGIVTKDVAMDVRTDFARREVVLHEWRAQGWRVETGDGRQADGRP